MTRILGTALAALLLAGLIGCGSGDDDHADGTVDRYTVRGTIAKLPDGGPDRSLYIRHAPIPDYKNAEGEAVGMMAMTMPFPVAEGVPLDGLKPGDPVEFTFTMRWKPTGHYEIVEMRALPAGTEIDFDTPMHGEHEH